MGKYDQNAKVYKKWIKEGRGQGHLQDYKPWLYVYNVPSQGRSSRLWSHTSKRVVHCLSDLETATLLQLDWAKNVIDIKEQYPLSLISTQNLANQLGFRHPAVRGENIVMTSDFLVTTNNASKPSIAFQVKPSAELIKPRVREKLAIEEAYWKENNVPFEIVTERSINPIIVQNIKWFLPISRIEVPIEVLSHMSAFWQQATQYFCDEKLIDLGKRIDLSREHTLGTGLGELRLLISKRAMFFDLTIPFYKLRARNVTFLSIDTLCSKSIA